MPSITINLRIGTEDATKLRRIASEVGAVAPSGIVAGQGSISALLRQIASGELVVRKGVVTVNEWDGTYRISDKRIAQVAKLAHVSEARVTNICTYDWPEGEEHQRWLDTAPVEEIASWVATISRDQDAGN